MEFSEVYYLPCMSFTRLGKLQRSPPFQRMRQRNLIGIFKVDADGDAASEARDGDGETGFLEVALQEERG